jgi:glycosyltransferase involved in cell wall biosynthesis
MLSTLLTQQFGRPVVNGRRIARILDEGNFDVINYHNASLVGGPGLFHYGNALKLYMAHEHWLVCPTHVLWRHGREVCTGRECVRCQLSYKRPPQVWRATGYLERAGRQVDAFIAMSEFSRAKHREFGFPFDMEVVPYFLEDEATAPPAGKRPHARPYFLFVGRLEKIKGLDDVIPLFREYEGADLLIAGDGEYAGELRTLAAGIDRVRFLGRVPLEDLRRYYEHATALVVPSVCFETFGIIIIEAFRQGTPVIARRIGPFPELVERSGGGMLFETAAQLRAAMEGLAADSGLRRDMAERARAAFGRHWSESAVIPRYLEVVRRVAQQRGRADVLRALGAAAPGPDSSAAQPGPAITTRGSVT